MGVAEKIYKAFEELQTACETIDEYGDCGKCPLRSYCIKDDDAIFGEAIYNIPLEAIDKFVKYAERLTDIGI